MKATKNTGGHRAGSSALYCSLCLDSTSHTNRWDEWLPTQRGLIKMSMHMHTLECTQCISAQKGSHWQEAWNQQQEASIGRVVLTVHLSGLWHKCTCSYCCSSLMALMIWPPFEKFLKRNLCISVCAWEYTCGPSHFEVCRRQKRALYPLAIWATDNCEPPCGFWGLNPGPLQKFQVLLTAESSLLP